MITVPCSRFGSRPRLITMGRLLTLSAASLVIGLLTPVRAELVWMRQDKNGVQQAGTGTNIKARAAAGERVTLYTTDFPALTLHTPGISATVIMNVTFEGDLAGMGSGNRFFAIGLFNNMTTATNFADDGGYFVQFRGVAADASLIELRKRLGNGKSPGLLNPSNDSRANIGSSKDIQTPGNLTEKATYQLVFRLARTAAGISFGEGRDIENAGLVLKGPSFGISAFSSDADGSADTFTFNELALMLNNTSSKAASISLDSMQIELRKNGQLVTVTSKPTINGQPMAQSALVGSRAEMQVEAAGGELVYQWKRNGENVPGAVSKKLVIEEVSLDDGGEYSVVVTNPYGATTSSTSLLQVRQMISLKPKAEPTDQIIYDEAFVEVKPEIRRTPRVKYPDSLKDKNLTGDNVLRFIVTSEGYVEAINVSKYLDTDMVAPLVAAYEKARFKPGTKDGKPVNVRVTVVLPYPPPKK